MTDSSMISPKGVGVDIIADGWGLSQTEGLQAILSVQGRGV